MTVTAGKVRVFIRVKCNDYVSEGVQELSQDKLGLGGRARFVPESRDRTRRCTAFSVSRARARGL